MDGEARCSVTGDLAGLLLCFTFLTFLLCDGSEKGVGFYRWRGGATAPAPPVTGWAVVASGDGGGHVGGKFTAVNAAERKRESRKAS